MKPLKPFFTYFGSKYQLSKHYPNPKKDILIEPFAGSACYSLHYPEKQVKLYDKYDVICGVWEYLIHANEKEILDLPLIDFDKTTDDYNIPQEAKWLIGFWIHSANYKPDKKWTIRQKNSATGYTDENGKFYHPRNLGSWTELNKIKIANQLQFIRHWTIEQKSYDEIENIDACWFIDPPYQYQGKGYVHSSKKIDFEHLGNWCKERQGQVIVCEGDKADWLPFETLKIIKNNQNKKFREVVWLNDGNHEQFSLF